MILKVNLRAHELLNRIYWEPKVGVEIGVFRGDLSMRLLSAANGIFLYLVDPWREWELDSTYCSTDDRVSRMSQDEHNRNMQQTLEKIAPYEGRYKVIRKTSADAASEFDDESLDFVFIDADHSYEGCKQDIKLWYPKVKHGGLLSGHDYRDEMGFGVIKAVDEFVQDTGHKLELGMNHTWFIRR